MDDFQLLSTSIFVPEKEQRYEKIQFRDVLFFQAEGSWVDIMTIHGLKNYRISTNLGNIEPQLNSNFFVRVSRKYIINIHRIVAIQGNIVVVGEEEIVMGKQYKDNLIIKLPILRTKVATNKSE